MRATRENFRKSAVALVLSMSALPNLVNAEPKSLTSLNKAKSSNRSELKDSVKDTKAGIAQLVAIMLQNGADGNITSILAPVIGLPKAMPMKKQEVLIRADESELRACYLIYENVKGAAPESIDKRAVCAYIVKIKRSGLDKETRYFRIDLNGKLEKVILSQSKFDETGKIVRGSGVKFDQDINSPEVKKTFAAEMNFWLKDWLKKEKKSAEAKKTTASATSSENTPAAAL